MQKLRTEPFGGAIWGIKTEKMAKAGVFRGLSDSRLAGLADVCGV